MKLIFRGHDDRYAVEQSLLAFFPEERPVYKPAEEGENNDVAFVIKNTDKKRALQALNDKLFQPEYAERN